MTQFRSKLPALLFVLAVMAGSTGRAGAIPVWHRDYASAMAQAKAENKKLLIVFTGTDWIEICTKFYDEILGEPAFMDAVSTKFALVKLEFPKDNRLPREEAAQKALLREAYWVRGFPTVVLTDAEGRPFGINGYQPVTAKEYADQLLAIETTHATNLAAAVAAAAGKPVGPERAKELSRIIPDLPGALVARFYRKEMESILADDPDDTLKLADRFRDLIAESDYEREMQVLSRGSKWGEMITLTDRHIADRKLEGKALQAALLNRSGFERRAGQEETATATLRKVREIDPESDFGIEAGRMLGEGEENLIPE